MNILILTHSYPDMNHKWRGIFIKEQARALSIKHNIIVVYFKVDYSHFAPFSKYAFLKKTDEKVTVYEVTVCKSFPVITQLKYLSNTFRFLKNEIFTRNHIDIVHSHLSYPAGFLGTILQKIKGIPNVLTEHSTIKLYSRSFLHKLCVNYTLRNASCIVPVSNSLKEEISSQCHRQLNVIHNIVDTEMFDLAKSKEGQIINIGFLGGLNNTNKGLDLLLKSVSMLERKRFFLHIGGNGILLDSFKAMVKASGIEADCKFYGEIFRSDIAHFYTGLDIFVLPSRYETFGIVLVEAMACGIPVIATKCGGPQDIVTPSTGMLIEKDDPEVLAKAIRTMSENLRSYDKEAIRRYASEKFGRSVFIDKMTKVYQDILTRYSNG
ncbi:MAG: glycosyltransferase family 4 protein [Bacteroidetes bacterium]|nr:MAG: glycosyltransferase family 4 protein [Bacteroidota bacterium]